MMIHKNKKLGTAIVIAATTVGMAGTANAGYVDAFGDATRVFGDPNGSVTDLAGINVQYDATNLYFEMTFHTPIAAPSTGYWRDGLSGFLEFDIDQSSSTGTAPEQNSFDPPFASLDTGWDYRLILSTERHNPGFVNFVNQFDFILGTVAVTYDTHSISGSISLDWLGGGDDGIVNFTALIGNAYQPSDATDYVGTSTMVPAPSAMVLLGLAGLAGTRRRR